jgi:hypothetical protein
MHGSGADRTGGRTGSQEVSRPYASIVSIASV